MLKSDIMTDEKWLMYLRKSRSDNPDETVEEVLQKHEMQLQEFARNELGKEIPEDCIYREVVSGESIDDREEIKKILVRIESPDIAGVIAIEPSRLSRGDLSDCARIIDAFRFTHSLVKTPYMTYNLENKMERKFFQDELLRGNDYLEYTKEILFRGRVAAAKRGCYIGSRPPFGYDRVKKGKDFILTPNDDADIVRSIFEWYTKENMTPGAIGRRLDDMGIKPFMTETWGRDTIRAMLENQHYIGKIVFNEKRTTWVLENGHRVKKRIRQPEDLIISEGKHPAIIDAETFAAAQAKIAANPHLKNDHELRNVFAGILRCKKCGYAMIYNHKKGTQARLTCKLSPICYKAAIASELTEAVIAALELSELPKLKTKLKNGDGNAAQIQKRLIDKLNKQLQEYREQEENQYDLLERRKYTQELFDKRNAALRKKMEECEKNIYLARSAMPQNVDYQERIATLEKAIETLKNDDIPNKEKNALLRTIIERIDYSSVDLGKNKIDIQLDIYLKL